MPNRRQVAGRNWVQPTAPALDGPRRRPKSDSTLVSAARIIGPATPSSYRAAAALKIGTSSNGIGCSVPTGSSAAVPQAMLGRPPATTANHATRAAAIAATAAPPPATPKTSARRLLGEAFIIGLAATAEHGAAGALVAASRAPRPYGGAALARRGAAWR